MPCSYRILSDHFLWSTMMITYFYCCGTYPPLQIRTTISSSLRGSPLRVILNSPMEAPSGPTAFPFANERMASVSSCIVGWTLSGMFSGHGSRPLSAMFGSSPGDFALRRCKWTKQLQTTSSCFHTHTRCVFLSPSTAWTPMGIMGIIISKKAWVCWWSQPPCLPEIARSPHYPSSNTTYL